LLAFLDSPAKHFLRTRLGLRFFDEEEPVADRLPLELDALAKWHVGDRVLQCLLTGLDLDAVVTAERLRGEVPVGPLGDPTMQAIGATAAKIAGAASALRTAAPTEQSINLGLTSGQQLTGVIPDIYGQKLVIATYSKLKPKAELAMWVKLLCLAVSDPASEYVGYLVCNRSQATIRPPHNSPEVLGQLVDLFARGTSEPLPFAPETAYAYAKKAARGHDQALQSASENWKHKYGEGLKASERRVWADFAALSAAPPRTDEAQWFPNEPTRLGVLSRRIWEPILEAGPLR